MRDTLNQIRELQNMDERELIQMGMMRAENLLIDGMEDIQTRIQNRQAGDWPERDEIRAHLEDLPDHQQREQFEQVLAAVEEDVSRVVFSYHEIALVEDGMSNFERALSDLIVSVHSPVVQESLLLAVSPDYRPRLRDQMREFGHLLWGWFEAIQGVEGGHADRYVPRLAGYWEMDPDELRQTIYADEQAAQEQ